MDALQILSADAPKAADAPLYVAIADHIEGLITSRRLVHNQALPSTQILAEHFGVTVSTAQHALKRLSERGWVRRKPKVGTFVNDAASSRSVAVTIMASLFGMESRFYPLFYRALTDAFAARGMDCVLHEDLVAARFDTSLRRLRTAVTDGEYACILAIASSQEYLAWMRSQDLIPSFFPCMPDLVQSSREVVVQMITRGYRRIGFVPMFNAYDPTVLADQERGIAEACAAHRLPADAVEILRWGETTNQAYHHAKAWFAATPREGWPDALCSHHDVATKGVLIALTELGIQVPRDLALATHANRGDSFAYPVALSRIEVDPAALATATVDHILNRLTAPKPGLDTSSPRVASTWHSGESLR